MNKIILAIALLLMIVGCDGITLDGKNTLIVIDAGHGGHDSGAVAGGKKEKDLVLQITKRLNRELRYRGYRVYFTRDSDEFIALTKRTQIADHEEAKVFISIHANAISNSSRFNIVEGVETYYLQKSRDARSQRIALRENASVLQGADKLSQDVIIDSVLNGPKIIQSHKLAIDVQTNMIRSLRGEYSGVVDGGVRPAPFYVLVGASRPSILVEVGYITNDKERERLFSSSYQKKLVEGLVKGISRYITNRKQEVGF